MLEGIKNKEAQYVLVEYKDRLARFGYTYLEKYIKDHGGEIIILDQQDDKDENQELVEDLIAITTSFSARIYGKRGGKKVAKRVENILKEEKA
ncbi:hypothetical protein CLFO_16800 [Clostridium formicaceticum]|jgi:predicted site-specific integrase-resolvase|uniref:Resolvase/invertase-type recombinase catalytic domain-containing protein n=1 Tax=Clostridium formicaceticum TaxID=1497 RepID=A0AAC9RJK6_9CLOT|nr:hypothetical protein BJL90_13685 [Clostridium formicaceticum]ARE87281.1 hypothetical protein CLFO_16800 [Clostridium formicaceticum]